MRILFLTNRSYLPQKVGGAESSTHAMIRALESRGNSCMVLSALWPWGLIGLKNRVKRKILRCKAPLDRSMGYHVARAWDVLDAITEIKAVFSPEVAVLLPSDHGTGKLVSPLYSASIPAVLHLRDVEFDSLGDLARVPLAGVVANSRFTAETFQAQYNKRADVVYNIVERDLYKSEHIGQHVTFINPVTKKGKEVAFALAERNPDIPFLFVEGWRLEAEEKKMISQRIRKHRNITWMRRTHDMRKVFSKTRILIVPSQCSEAWGRVVSEAHVSGIPVLASKIGGLPESVGIGGRMIGPEGVESWHSTLREVWDDTEEWRRLSRNAYEYGLRAELNADAIAESYERLLLSYVDTK